MISTGTDIKPLECLIFMRDIRSSNYFEQIKRYRQSVLRAAVEGELTREWREQHKDDLEPASVLLARILRERREKWEANQLARMQAQGKTPKDDKWKANYEEPVSADSSALLQVPTGWQAVTGNSIFLFVTSGSRGWSRYYSDTGALFLRMGNLDHDTVALDLTNIQRVQPPEYSEGTRTRVMPKDILISITADVGMIAVIPEGIEEAYINQHVALARPSSFMNEKFVAWFLVSEDGGIRQFHEMQRGATKLGLGLDDIKAVCLPIPPLAEQDKIVAEIECRISVADEIEISLDAELKRAERLRQSVLKRAFEGRLVPQDPNDEPASALLERIRMERAQRSAQRLEFRLQAECFGYRAVPPEGGTPNSKPSAVPEDYDWQKLLDLDGDALESSTGTRSKT